jgi:hypothetical protein
LRLRLAGGYGGLNSAARSGYGRGGQKFSAIKFEVIFFGGILFRHFSLPSASFVSAFGMETGAAATWLQAITPNLPV